MFYRYYTEIKFRTFLFFVTSFLSLLVSYIYKEILLNLVLNAYSTTSFNSFELSYFIFTDVVEVFNVYVYLIFFVVKQILIFHFFYHLLIFLAPGLTRAEYRFCIFLFSTSTFFFLLAIIVFNKLIFPFSWNFFLSFKDFMNLKLLTLHFEAKLMDYVMFFFTFYFSCVIYFQFFLFPFFFFIYFGKELGIYKFFRKFIYYACIIFSTVVTPPDVTSQIFLSVMLIIGCEILVYCSLLQKVLRK